MTQLDDFAAPKTAPRGGTLSVSELLRVRFAGIRLRARPLWSEIKTFAQWLEAQCFPAARKAGLDRVLLEIKPDGRVQAFAFHPPKAPAGLSRLSSFLQSICVEQVQLDPRLESNQVTDVLALLYANRRALSRRDEPSADRGGLTGLWGQTGLEFACTRTQIIADRLAISYSYCMTRFSRLAWWFERRSHHFQDHRALFHAAPRYAVLTALIVMGLAVAYAFYDGWPVLAALTVLAAAALSAITYLFFMVVGSVEYDNEEKARRLAHAYDQLKRNADRIQEDLSRARGVQEKMLPEISTGPLAGRADWASRFIPAEEVGGDYYDVIALDNHRAAMLFADVSGHGMAAAFITAILKTSFQAWADDGGSLGEFLVTVNRNLCRLTPEGSFAAVFAAIYDADAGRLSYVNCGHNPEPWLIPARPTEPVAHLQASRAMLLGITEQAEYRPAEQSLAPGDTVLLATDGLVEARNIYDRMYGAQKLADLLAARRSGTVEALVDLVMKDVTDYARGAEQSDDRTILAFQIK